MDTTNDQKKDLGIVLPKEAVDEMDNEEISEIILGSEARPDRGTLRMRRVKKIIAVCLWITTVTIVSALGKSDSLEKLMGISTLGLMLALFGDKFSSYEGPVWPMAGRFGQRIDKPTPNIVIVFFGWVLLIIMLLILSTIFLSR